MLFNRFAVSRLLAVSGLATAILTTVAEAQMNGQGQGQGSGIGNMMGGYWGRVMGSGIGWFGGISVVLLALAVMAIVVLAFRRRSS